MELTVVIGMVGIILGAIFVFVKDMIAKRRAIDTELRIEAVIEALEHYQDLNGHFPCPASRSDVVGAAAFGKEANSGDCTYTAAPSGTLRVETAVSSGIWVLIGVLPVKDLGLSSDMIRDGYNNRFSYAVMQSAAEMSTFNAGVGGLIIKDGGGNNIITDGAYVVISHGYDEIGAYDFPNGTLKSACGATNLDIENCDWDVTFVDAPYNNGSVAANYFDDFIRWSSKASYN